MAIGTVEVSIGEIAVEMSKSTGASHANLSLKNLSQNIYEIDFIL